MTDEIEIVDNFRAQQRDDVRADGVGESGVDLLTDCRTANDVSPFEDESAPSLPREISSGYETIVATTDYDGIVAGAHQTTLWPQVDEKFKPASLS